MMKTLNQVCFAGGVLMACLFAPQAHSAVTLTTLVSFTGTNGLYPGAAPYAGLALGGDGNFYGTAAGGGQFQKGTVFQLTPGGVFKSLLAFDGTNGANPAATLVQSADGSFYGTTQAGGPDDLGTVFQITTNGAIRTLLLFSASNHSASGASPTAPLFQASGGALVSTAQNGGPYTNLIPVAGGNGYGTVFQLDTNGQVRALASFSNTNGAYPSAGVVLGKDGNFYGTTTFGGSGIRTNWPGYGTIFRLARDGSFTNLYQFSGGSDGGLIYAGLVQGGDGSLYGAAFNGGAGYGTLFRFNPSGVFTNLHLFNDADGDSPYAGMIQASDGNFYGTTFGYFNQLTIGTIFRLSPGGAFTNLYSFPLSGTNGFHPIGALAQGPDGELYGTTSAGGALGYGTIFKLSVPMPPAILSASLSGGGFTFTWNAVAGQSYQAQFTSDLGAPAWQPLGSSLTATNGTVTVTDSSLLASRRLYRVVLLP